MCMYVNVPPRSAPVRLASPLSTPSIHFYIFYMALSFFYTSPPYATFKWRQGLTQCLRMSTIRWAMRVQTSSRVVFLFLLYSFCFPLPQQTRIETLRANDFRLDSHCWIEFVQCFFGFRFDSFLCVVLKTRQGYEKPCQSHARDATDWRN